MPGARSALAVHIASALEKNSEALCSEWRQEIESRSPAECENLGREGSIVDMPELVRWVAASLRVYSGVVDSAVHSRLQLVVQVRRERGYTMDQTLSTLDLLSERLWNAFREASATYPSELKGREWSTCALRLCGSLRAIRSAVIELWRTDEGADSEILSRGLQEFASMVVHELKNPLGAIQLWADALEEDSGDDPVMRSRCFSGIHRSAQRIADLLDDIRLLAVAEGAQASEREIRLPGLLNRVVEELGESAEAREVEVRVEGEIPPIPVDAVQVQIALMNLVSNAIKYSDPRKEERWVCIRVRETEQERRGWRIEVADNGLGIPDHLQHKVFRRNFRAHPDAAEGTGLGLAITDQVIRQRHGEIGFESREGEGSLFYIVITERSGASRLEPVSRN